MNIKQNIKIYILTFLMLVIGVGESVVKAEDYTISTKTGWVQHSSGATTGTYFRYWYSNNTSPLITIDCGVNNIAVSGDNLNIYPGSGSNVSITVDGGYIITGIRFDYKSNGSTISYDSQTIVEANASGSWSKQDFNSNQVTFRFAGTNQGTVLSNFIVTVHSLEDGFDMVYNGSLDNARRQINSITLNGQTITVGESCSYFDKTAQEFIVNEGETLTAGFTWSGNWMHGYIYIDIDNDGSFKPYGINADGTPQDGSNLVAYSAYSATGNKADYKNSAGITTPDDNPGLNPPTFIAPSAGVYRMRFKTDWNSLAPCGGSGFKSGSGVAVDVTLRVLSTSYTDITSLSDITDSHGNYRLTADCEASGTVLASFSGRLDGNFHKITGVSSALFGTLNGATVKNVILEDVSISGTTVGAIANTATGNSRVYNCGILSGTVSASEKVGSIVGEISGNARIVNCYSFANVSGGTYAAGIVGYNPTATITTTITTSGLIANCMYYGQVTGGTNRSPVYGGVQISNTGATGINNYNYFALAADNDYTSYNGALAAEEMFLKRFELYRGMLNSNRELCAYYATGNAANTAEIAKWVLEPETKPYPILKPWDYYPSVVNHKISDVTYTADDEATHYVGAKMGTLSVTVNHGANGSGSTTLDLPITDIDTSHNDYNYYKVQLPYYNMLGGFSGNYENGKVVTGWKITAISGGTNHFATEGDNAYNFADRKCTDKDLYSTSGRVFAQGGYFNVPEGVTAITIEAYWGNAVFLSDEYLDMTTNNNAYTTKHNTTVLGNRPNNGTFNGRTVYKSLTEAKNHFGDGTTVYDNAIVLVGNYHHHASENAFSGLKTHKAYTMMSLDQDADGEPDYALIHADSDGRVFTPGLRFDFLNYLGWGMASKSGNDSQMRNKPIYLCYDHFEITETCPVEFAEFEYDYFDSSNRTKSPVILNNGYFRQFTSGTYYNGGWNNANKNVNHANTSYIIVGGNCYFPLFSPGNHPATGLTGYTAHAPVSVLGGEYEKFYLSGMNADESATPTKDNAELYVNGGYIHEFAAGYHVSINGDVLLKVDNLIADEFYCGSSDAGKPTTGNIVSVINNSRIGIFCGGPKFGDMAPDTHITTTANNTTFSEFYGAGWGGTSLYRKTTLDSGKSYLTYDQSGYNAYMPKRLTDTDTGGQGVRVSYAIDMFQSSGGNSNVNRFYEDYASFSTTAVHEVSSTLNGCTINGNFYGAGHLGAVTKSSAGSTDGNVSSVITDCIINGSAYGAGYTSAIPTINVLAATAPTFPSFNGTAGFYTPIVYPEIEVFTWTTGDTDTANKLIHTDQSLTDLGTVTGNTSLTIKGADSVVTGDVFGGGAESKVLGNSTVIIGEQP